MTLHDQLEAAIKERLAVAQAATAGPWISASNTGRKDGIALVGALASRGTGRAVAVLADADVRQRHLDAKHIAANGPDRIVRDCERDLKVLARHKPSHGDSRECNHCELG